MPLNFKSGYAFLMATMLSLPAFSTSRPVTPHANRFARTIRNMDEQMLDAVLSHKKRNKVCSCQILTVQSRNYERNSVALLAEKTNDGDLTADFSRAKRIVEKEKKYMTLVFYDRVRVVNRISAPTDCQSLYAKLKATYRTLALYDILDADVRK